MSGDGSEQVKPCLHPAHCRQHCERHNHQKNCLLVHVPPEHKARPGADGEGAEKGGEGVGGEPQLGQGGQDCYKGDDSCGGWWHGGENGVGDVLHKASSHTCGGNFRGQLAKSLASNSQCFVGNIVESPKVRCPICMAETSFERKEAGKNL